MASPYTAAEDFQLSPHGAPTVDTTTGHFRAGFARCALAVNQFSGPDTRFWRLPYTYGLSAASFWFSARFYINELAANPTGATFLSFLSTGDVERIRIRAPDPRHSTGWIVDKITAGSVATTLGTFSGPVGIGVIQKIDIQVNYAVAGSIAVYLDGDIQMSYSGDITTDGVTALTGWQLGSFDGNSPSGITVSWSEIFTRNFDTRSLSLVTQAPTGLGNTDAWPNGTYTDVNEIVLNDATSISTNTANQLDEFVVNSLPTGNWGIVDNTIALRSAAQAGAPQHIEPTWRTHSADYPQASQAQAVSLAGYWVTEALNPATAAAWTQAELNDPAYNIGVKSIA